MKKIFTVLLLMQLYYAELSPAQNNVGIGTNTPDASAKIDITSSNKGLLIPRIALISTTDATTIPSPATSLLIYNTATAGVSPNNVTPGFYYNSNTPASPTWTRLNTSNYSDTLGWTKALSTATKATKTDNQYVTGKIGVGDFSSTTPAANLQVIGTTIIGSNTNTATGINSFASGAGTNASGSRTFVTGENNLNAADNSIVAGYASRIESGYGHSIAVGYTDTLVASASAAFGFGNKVTGFTGFAAGDRNKVTGQTATSFGYQNNATGTNSFSIGQSNNATGNLSFVNGINNTAASYVETVLGLNGTTYTPSSTNTYNANDRLLNVGNGSSSGSRSDAFTILKNGNIGINNNTPNSSSILDINSSSKGIRLPNVALTSTTDASTITTPVTSLLIYNTAIAGVSPNNVTPGFYYNSNTSASPIWTRLNTNTIADTLGWTKALTTTTKAIKADNQYVTGNIGVGNFSSISPSDKIHVKGNLRIDSGRIDFRNTGQSIFVGEGAGINDDLAARSNVAIGYNTLNQNSTGNNNVAIGTGALEKNTASLNTAVGRFALNNLTTGFTNAAFGESALRASTTGFDNTALGQNSLRFNSTGNRNTAVGNGAGYSNTGTENIFLGYQAGYNETGNNKLYIENSSSATPLIYGDFSTNQININGSQGINTLPNVSAVLDISSTNKGIRLPNIALTSTTDAATIATPATSLLIYNTATAGVSPNNVTPGYYYNSNTPGSPIWTRLNTITIADTLGWTKALTTNTKATIADNQYVTGNVGIGDFSVSNPSDKLHVKGNIKVDAGRIPFVNTGQSVFIGENAGMSDDLTNNINVFVGKDAGLSNTNGEANTFVGILSGRSNTTGNLNTAFGAAALDNNTIGASNVAVGRSALSANSTGNNNVAIGESALHDKTLGSDNVVIGFQALTSATNVANNVAVGKQAGYSNLNGNGNIFLGYTAGYNETGSDKLYIDNSNTATPLIYGDFASNHITINDSLTSKYFQMTNGAANGFVLRSDATGNATWINPTSLITDTVSWTKALTTSTKATTTDDQYVTGNIGVGDFSAAAPNDKVHVKGNLRIDSGRIDFRNTGQSVFVGEGAGINDDLAARSNVAIGYNSLNQNTTGNNNVAIGTGALEKNTASFNTAVGRYALKNVTTGFTNAAFGESTLRSSTTGFENTAFGQASLRFNITGNRNTVVGSAAGYNNTGSANIFFGYQAGFNETGNNKLYIENSSSATPLIYGDFASNHITINDSLTSKYFQMTNGAANGFVLRSDATGNATWTNPATLITDTSSWTKALTTNTTANKSDNQYVTGKVGIGDFSASTPNANIQVIGNGNIGTGNTISGTNSFVTGFNNTVTGTQAFSTGGGNNVSGNYSVALNNTNTTTSSATTSIVGGYQSYVSSNIGLAIGYNDTTTAQAAAAFGFDNNAAGANSFAAGGASNIASGANSLATGSNNSVTATQAFAAGGNNNAAGVNSFVAGGTNNNVSGNNSFVTGFNNTVTGTQAFAAGGGNNVAGNYSVALNNTNTTTNTATTSLVGGYQSYVTSNIGLAIGQNDTTTGQAAAAFGFDNNAAGVNSFVAGTDNLAASYSETALGINGTRYTPASATTYNATDRIFNVGNGASASNRADAFTILKNGNIGVNNNTPNSSAILDISSINKGIRLPNVPLTSAVDAATITAPALSLLIYNTEFDGVAPNNVVPGYYYNSGTPASPKWSRFVTSTDSIGWIKALSSSSKAIKTDNQYVTGNIGIGDFSAITPSNNISFTQGANKTIGAERSTTAGTYYNLTVQAGGAMAGQNNNHGGDLILSGGTATGNGGSVSDLGSNVIFKTATPLGSSSNADQTPTEKVRIKGDGTVNVATMAGTGNRTVIVDANGNLSASKNMVYVEDRAERTTDATNSGFRSIGSSTGNLAVNTGDVIAISLTLKFKWTGGTGTDQARFGINITGCTSATVTDTYEKEDADDVNRNQYQPFSAQYIYTATCNGNLQFNLLMDSNSNADDNAKTGDVVIVARKL